MNTQTESLKKVNKVSLREKVLALFGIDTQFTAQQVSDALGIKLCSATARIHELRALGQLYVVGTAYDDDTNRDVNLYSAYVKPYLISDF